MRNFLFTAALVATVVSAVPAPGYDIGADVPSTNSPPGYDDESNDPTSNSPPGYDDNGSDEPSNDAPGNDDGSGSDDDDGDDDEPENLCGATSTTNHRVVTDDTLTSIANAYNSGICDIVAANDLDNPNLIFPDQVLIIPVDCTDPDNESCLNPTPTPDTCVPGVGSTWIVRPGDTLSQIATNFEITLEALEGANQQITDPDLIVPGQLINIPICPDSACETVGTYVIQANDIFLDLAEAYNTSVGQIETLNQGVNASTLAIGQIIILPQNCANITSDDADDDA